MSETSPSKQELREKIRAERLKDNPELTLARNRRVLELPEIAAANSVALFVSISDEPSTAALRESLTEHGTEVLLPILRADKGLDWGRDHGALEVGRFGLLHPAGSAYPLHDADVVIVPVVAVDASGRRLGRGGGSYDRAIAAYREHRTDGLVVALAFEGALVEELPAEPHDQPVDAVITEARTVRFAQDRDRAL